MEEVADSIIEIDKLGESSIQNDSALTYSHFDNGSCNY